ncbi:beta-ketoacyl synthase chain length factor [Flavihumibacter sp.]|uniref:beta-ketoacyl synthase chain length factor n=1 Tax=Flavihumibacter sp. TaxID=1913981 RepID=UPI002FCAA8AB
MFIIAASTISYQPTFQNKGFSSTLTELDSSALLREPDYSGFIPAMDRRRMSEVQKMAITCSLDCLAQVKLSQPDGIIVGTSMGCCANTKNFLDKIISSGSGPLAPTFFIVSTHNTIAGQISLIMKNHGYNCTHTQNSLSFEQSLLDGVLCIREGGNNILLGGADETEEAIYSTNERLNREDVLLTSGSSFFILSKEETDSCVRLVDVVSLGLVVNPAQRIENFLQSNARPADEIDLVLYANSTPEIYDELIRLFGLEKLIDYQKLSGTYFTSSAFAMHFGVDILLTGAPPHFREGIKNILICNNLIPENLGLVLLRKQPS